MITVLIQKSLTLFFLLAFYGVCNTANVAATLSSNTHAKGELSGGISYEKKDLEEEVKTGGKCPLGPKDSLTLSILGAPASGKSFYRDQLAKCWPSLKDATNLTVDILREQFQKGPTLVKLYELFKTYNFVKDLDKKYPTHNYEEWLSGFKKSIDGVMKELQIIGPLSSVSLSAVEPELKFSYKGKPMDIYSFLSAIRGSALDIEANIEDKIFASPSAAYNKLKRTVRKIQDEAIQAATLYGTQVIFDESGDEPSKLMDRLLPFQKARYNNYIMMIHPETVLINYLQNASRMIKGTDGGRDSSSAIIDAYKAIRAKRADYEDKGDSQVHHFEEKILPNPTPDDLSRVFNEFVAKMGDMQQEIRDNPGTLANKIVRYVLWLNIADVPAIAARIETDITKGAPLHRDYISGLWLAILKLHLSNDKKTYPELNEEIAKQAPEFKKRLDSISNTQAYQMIYTASLIRSRSSGQFENWLAGIDDSVVIEAREVLMHGATADIEKVHVQAEKEAAAFIRSLSITKAGDSAESE